MSWVVGVMEVVGSARLVVGGSGVGLYTVGPVEKWVGLMEVGWMFLSPVRKAC